MGTADRPGSAPDPAFVERIENILDEIKTELVKSMTKHAPMHSPHEGSSVIREEFDELWEHVMADTGRTPAARKEALQVAAMGVRYALDLCHDPVRDDRGPVLTLQHDDHFNHDTGC